MTTRGSEVSAWVKADTRDSKDIRCGWKPWVTLLKSTNYLCRRSTLITSTNCRIIPFIYRPPGKNEQTLLAHKTSTHVVHASANFACSNKLCLLCHNTSTKIESRKLLVPPQLNRLGRRLRIHRVGPRFNSHSLPSMFVHHQQGLFIITRCVHHNKVCSSQQGLFISIYLQQSLLIRQKAKTKRKKIFLWFQQHSVFERSLLKHQTTKLCSEQ